MNVRLRMPRVPRIGALLCVVALALTLPLRPVGADAPPADPTTVADAFARLRSPLRAVRQDGVRALVALLPGVRARVIEALAQSDWTTQVHLADVLAHDDSDASLAVLLKHFEGTDETQALLIRKALLDDDSITNRLLATYRKDPKLLLRGAPGSKRAAGRRADLVTLLIRAEIEQKFLSRKSTTGSTGYYKGQYDLLKAPALGADYRKQALETVAGIALDEAVPVPGVYRTGVYRFVRPHHVDEWELRGMAINAVAELCTSEDDAIIRRIRERLAELQRRREKLYYELRRTGARVASESKPFQDALMAWDDALGLYADFLACLYLMDPSRELNELVESFLLELESYRRWPYVPIRRRAYIAGLLIRVGWYERAIFAYQEMTYAGGSKALGYYNQACAYGNWSLRESLSPRQRAMYVSYAIRALREAVAAGWSDIGWMDQDRDLDPVRDTKAYRDLVEDIRKRLLPPPDDD